MAKNTIFGTEARKSIQVGVNTVVKAVATSYGPAGRTSIIAKDHGSPEISNDGVTIAKAIELEGAEQMGVALIQQAASKTNDVAGDGTSVSTILAGAIVNEGVKVVEAGSDPVKVRIGLQKASIVALEYLEKHRIAIDKEAQMAQVATISSRSEKIGSLIASAITKVGKNGVVTVQTGDSNEVITEITEGMQFDKGYKSPYFVTDAQRMESVVEKPMVLVTDQKITSVKDVVNVIEAMAQSGKKDLVIIADDIDGEALATFVLNKVRGVFNVYPIQAPSFGDKRKGILEDLAILVGAKLISSDLSMQLKDITIEDLGKADRVVSNKDTTTIVGGKGDKKIIDQRCRLLEEAIDSSNSSYDKEKFAERLAKLSGGVAVIKVGASTEVEMQELKFLVEDALNATKAAIAEGIVAGGAVTLVRIANELEKLKLESDEEQTGVKIFSQALIKPFRTIASNSGIYDIALLLEKIEKSKTFGYDFRKLEEVADMIKSGIVDPVLVLKEAIKNSVSVASSIITTEVVVFADPAKEDSHGGMGGNPMMGGMGGMM